MNERRMWTGAMAWSWRKKPGREATARSLYATDAPPSAVVEMEDGNEPPISRWKGKKCRPALSVRECRFSPSKKDQSWLHTT